MKNEHLYHGFDKSFLKNTEITESINLPEFTEVGSSDVVPIENSEENTLNYLNYSVALSASRKFPFYTASNIDGKLFKKIARKGSWKKDRRAKEFQFGLELYQAEKSDFDRGHMVKREDVQWGDTMAIAQVAAESTFYYSNSVPQHKDLNRKIWVNLEDYILHKEKELKICVFTGPVLSSNDPEFVTLVNDESIKIPRLFWKIIVYPKKDGKLYRVGFMMSQESLLIENDIVVENELESSSEEDHLFLEFSKANTYQVNVSLIEKLTHMKFHNAIDAYEDNRNIELVLNEIDIDPDLESFSIEQYLGYSIENITL